jgi:N utilization substance protein A
VIVPDDQLSLAIGREGQNARLAAKLTGWRIDIKSVTEAVQEALDTLDTPPLREVQTLHAEMIENVRRIVEKRAANRAVMPEEFTALAKFADIVQRRLIAARATARQARLKEIEAVRQTLPQGAFQMPLTTLGLSENVTEALQQFENVGEIMLRFLIDENRIRRALSEFPPDTFRQLQEALDKLVIPEFEAPPAEVEPTEEAVTDEVTVTPLDAIPQPGEDARRPVKPAAAVVQPVFEDEDEEAVLAQDKKGKGKKNKGRQLVFDEKTGGMVVKRQRKGGRGDWNNWEE